MTQIAFDAQPSIDLDAQLRVEDREAVAPDRLRAVHRDVRLVDQAVGGLLGVLGDREPDAGRDDERVTADLERPAERRQHFPGVVQVEEIHGRRVLSFEEADLQVPHEPGRRHPEIIPHHHDGLEMFAIALTKGGDQLGVLLTSLGMEPLLELVQDQQHLALRWQDLTFSQFRQRMNQPRSSGQFRTNLA